MKPTFALQDRKVLVTGGARGIGLHLSHQIIAQGGHVLAVGRNQEDLDHLQNLYPEKVTVLQADLSDHDQPIGVANWVADQHPDCSVLINNAAVMFYPDMTQPDIEMLEQAATEISVNLTAPITLCMALLPVLARQKSAAIVNVTSGLAIAPKPSAPVYCATKSGLRSFTKTLRYQCQGAGLPIQVSEAVMTLVDTSLSRGDPAQKLPAPAAAQAILNGLCAGKHEILIEKVRLLKAIHRLSPALADRIMRRGDAPRSIRSHGKLALGLPRGGRRNG